MLGTKFSKNKKAQHGSVMLEVIAVLALMGVMGSMLFRQIYQRNQELHNIQMASEIRTVKEAFSAYIQAYRAVLLDRCSDRFTPNAYQVCDIENSDYDNTKRNLPNGWFDEGNLNDYYTFSLVTYQQTDSSQKKVIIGFIVPTENTLPTTGWNFKRAARVALLVGADGGVYQNGITGTNIAGSLGTWVMADDLVSGLTDLNGQPTYVAMTGLDVFTPEYELPEGKVNLPENWRLATEELGAWNYFSAGGTKENCYTIGHTRYDASGNIGSDNITKTTPCSPLFYVDNTNKKVFVNNDLEIGSGTTTNLTLTQEGVIKQKDGLTIDANGRIILKDKLSANTGELNQNDPYVIDPKYTSVMGDIRLVSRGGVRLSDILPNYILKEVKTITGGDDITIPTCPKGYKKAIVVTPVSWDQGEVTFKKGTSAITATSFPVAATTADLTGLKGTVSSAPGDVSLKKGTSAITATSFPVAATTTDLTELKGTVTEGICVKITRSTTTTTGLKDEGSTVTGQWTVVLGHKNADNSCTNETDIKAIAQTYCVYNNTGDSADMTQEECTAAGFTWDNDTTNGKIAHCKYVYQSCSTISTSTAISDENKPAVCKAAGCTWDGRSCS